MVGGDRNKFFECPEKEGWRESGGARRKVYIWTALQEAVQFSREGGK